MTEEQLKDLMFRAGITPTGRHIDAVTVVCCEVSARLLIAVDYYINGGQSPKVGERAIKEFNETVDHAGCG